MLERALCWMVAAMVCFAVAISTAALAGASGAPSAHPASRAGCPAKAEDDPRWNWHLCGNHKRGVVTMWGTPKVVTCGEYHWLVTHGDLDPHNAILAGDRECGDRRV